LGQKLTFADVSFAPIPLKKSVGCGEAVAIGCGRAKALHLTPVLSSGLAMDGMVVSISRWSRMVRMAKSLSQLRRAAE
jgi:uncharacterized membrane protein YdfJ with MMPL/SSD domain